MVTTQLLSKDFLLAGDEVDGFRLLEIIGGGGEGSVWSAWDIENERIVALKFTANDPIDSQYAARKSRMGDLVALDHPNIREIYTTGSMPTMDYIALRYYPFGSVDSLLKSNRLQPEAVLMIAAQIVSALEFVHQRGIVHRDLKPTNVLLDSQLRAYLTDFGIAKEISNSTVALHTGQGTPAYSSPEQHTRAPVNLKTDIYSFGIMLFEMFTGELPWKGFTSLAMKQLDTGEEIPDPRSEDPSLPANLHQALLRLTTADPEKRPNSMAEAFQVVLDAWYAEALPGLKSANERLLYDQVLPHISPKGEKDSEILNEARALLRRTIHAWNHETEPLNPRLTEFLYLSAVFSRPDQFSYLSTKERDFLVYSSILHGRNMAFWWGKAGSPEERLALSERLFEREVGEALIRVMKLLLLEPDVYQTQEKVTRKLISQLVSQLEETNSPDVIENALILLQSLLPEHEDWQDYAFSSELDGSLAQLALSDQVYSGQAIALIAQVKSIASLDTIIRISDAPNKALGRIRELAGSLPASVGSGTRIRVFAHAAWTQITGDWNSALRIFLAASLAVALGLGIHVFITTRLPSYLDAGRLLNTLGSGLLFGPLIGLGVFLNRWLVQRMKVLSPLPRITLGILAGGLVVYLGFAAFHYLFLNASLTGIWMLVGSFIFSLGFSLGDGLAVKQGLRMFFASIFVGLALLITNELASKFGTSPMLYYEREETLITILLVLAFSGIVGIVSQLFNQEIA